MKTFNTGKEARAAGAKFYCTGKPCKRGHIADRQAINGLCVECMKVNQRRHYEQNRDEYIARAQESYRLYPEQGKARAQKSALKNAHKAKPRYAAYRRKMGSQLTIYQQLWRLANPERSSRISRARDSARRAREIAAPGIYSGKDVLNIYQRQRGKCANCEGKLSDYHVDHVVAISRGGTNFPTNLQLLCPPCNRRKGAKDPIDFAQEQGRLL